LPFKHVTQLSLPARKNASGGDLGSPDDDWRKILELAPKILKQESKDLEVACWYAEALLRRYGFVGLKDALLLIQGLIEQYWPSLFPQPDEDGLETKVAPLTGLNGAGQEGVLMPAIRATVITQGQSVGPFATWECQKALSNQRIQDEENREREIQKLGFSLLDIEKAIQETSTDFLIQLRDALIDSIDLYRAIGQQLDELCGLQEAPPTSLVVSTLEDSLSILRHLAQHKFPSSDTTLDASESEIHDADQASVKPQTSGAAGPIATREQAFKQMLEIADFFRKREPHSPVSYILEKAVKWGNMTLSELMRELISDSGALDQYCKLTGVKAEDE
jgi:type VI secretion system protein ImpA